MDAKGIDSILSQMRTAAALAAGKPAAVTRAPEPPRTDFAQVLKSSVDHVNSLQQQSAKLAADFETGVREANLHDVMISLQKANMSFQQMVQVRNRLVSAYHEIMNMQV